MTKEMIKILFPNTKDINEVVNIIEQYRNKFGLNTDLRLGHFLAQVREEIGSDFKVLRENLNYSEKAVLSMWPKRFSIEDAEKYARDEDTPIPNQEVIANIAYGNRLGNGAPDSDGDGDMDRDDDGFKYRGAGCLQITGKSNFIEVQKRCVKYAGKEMNPDTLEGFIVFGMAFWMRFDLYRLADKGVEDKVVDSITAKINYYTHSYENRVNHFRKIKNLINI
jgi:putative chitinase